MVSFVSYSSSHQISFSASFSQIFTISRSISISWTMGIIIQRKCKYRVIWMLLLGGTFSSALLKCFWRQTQINRCFTLRNDCIATCQLSEVFTILFYKLIEDHRILEYNWTGHFPSFLSYTSMRLLLFPLMYLRQLYQSCWYTSQDRWQQGEINPEK